MLLTFVLYFIWESCFTSSSSSISDSLPDSLFVTVYFTLFVLLVEIRYSPVILVCAVSSERKVAVGFEERVLVTS